MRPLSARRPRRCTLSLESLDRLVLLSSDVTSQPVETPVEVDQPTDPPADSQATDDVADSGPNEVEGSEGQDSDPTNDSQADVDDSVITASGVADDSATNQQAAENTGAIQPDPTTTETPPVVQTTSAPAAQTADPVPPSSPPPAPVPVDPTPQNLRVTMTVERTSEFAGRTIRFHLQELNVGKQPIRLGPLYDFDVVVSQGGVEVWRLSDVQGQRGLNSTLSFEPNAGRGVSVWWDGFRSRGDRTPVGGPIQVYAIMDGVASASQDLSIRQTPASQPRPNPQATRVEVDPAVTPTTPTASTTDTQTPSTTVPVATTQTHPATAPVVTLARTSSNRPNNRSFAFRRQVELTRRLRTPGKAALALAQHNAQLAAQRLARHAQMQRPRRSY
jgi:hypothetical protein